MFKINNTKASSPMRRMVFRKLATTSLLTASLLALLSVGISYASSGASYWKSIGNSIRKTVSDAWTKTKQVLGLINGKDYSFARWRLDELWGKIAALESEIEEYYNIVREIRNPTTKAKYFGKGIEYRIELSNLRERATDLEIKLASLMD